MILTGKAKEVFKKWVSDYSEKWHHLEGWRDYDQYIDEVELPETLQYALIQEWFDSVGLHINCYGLPDTTTNKIVYDWAVNTIDDVFVDEILDFRFTRQEAMNAAIEKCNEIYNT